MRNTNASAAPNTEDTPVIMTQREFRLLKKSAAMLIFAAGRSEKAAPTSLEAAQEQIEAVAAQILTPTPSSSAFN